ncbi:MAG TPA: sigma-70 family RNA polymerase sigma factor [Pseudonocardiaceae bacterium]|jgi:RNA polymerase sigma factor (sigma-70 family)|nr:sigma-70 family RNA polymerase sigma factor [Pseudonocardiaceae bacterium]
MSSPASTQTRESTAVLLRAADDRHPFAWEELDRRYGRLVRSTVASFRLQEADAEDAVQNTWLRVMERMDTIRDPERLGGWLVTTARRECLALLRRGRREVPDDVAGKQLVATEEGPEVAVVAGEVHRAVGTAVGELTGRRRVLIERLFYDPDCNYTEVSRATGMPRGSIGPTRLRVLRELRGTLEQRGFGPQLDACVGASNGS